MKRHADNVVQVRVDMFLSSRPLPASEESACPYLPGQRARNEGFAATTLPPDVYRALMDRGFRRSGRLVYRPVCSRCRACRQIRVPVETFRMTRSQRRVWRRNRDISVTLEEPSEPTPDKHRLFISYVLAQHDGQMPHDYDDFVRFLYDSPTETREFVYRLEGRVVGLSLVDHCPDALSSVYMYYDPAVARRSLGTFSILWEIEFCRRYGISHYYLGYHVAGSPKMEYKARFGPHELLDDAFRWNRGDGE